MTDKPESPAGERPDGKPYYIDEECPDCGTELVPYSSLTGVQLRSSDELADPRDIPDEEWHDEFACPVCLDGLHMDWPLEDCSECGREFGIPLLDSEDRCPRCIPTEEHLTTKEVAHNLDLDHDP